MNVNTLTERQYCRLYCGRRGSARRGDVQVCRHGRLFWFEGTFGVPRWRRLSPVLTPFLYRRAIRALDADEAAR